MKLAISSRLTDCDTSFVAQVVWSRFDAGKVGTPGAVCYGDTRKEAIDKLSKLLTDKGHTIVVDRCKDFNQIIGNCDDQEFVRQLLNNLVPLDVQDEIVEAFNCGEKEK